MYMRTPRRCLHSFGGAPSVHCSNERLCTRVFHKTHRRQHNAHRSGCFSFSSMLPKDVRDNAALHGHVVLETTQIVFISCLVSEAELLKETVATLKCKYFMNVVSRVLPCRAFYAHTRSSSV